MSTQRRFIPPAIAGFVLIAGVAIPAHAQTDMAALAGKRQFSRSELAEIASWVQEKAAALRRAQRSTDRVRVRDDFLRLLGEAGVTQEFREAFGRECGRSLKPLLGNTDVIIAHTAVQIIAQCSAAASCDALATALSSPHAAVRYRAARAIEALHGRLKLPQEYEPVLDALGQAGAAETDPIVLDRIYRAVDFGGGGQFAGQAAIAKALVTILDARLKAFENGVRHESVDVPAFEAAGRVYAAVRDEELRNKLVTALARYLAYGGERYLELGPASGGVALAAPVQHCEEALVQIVRSANGAGSPPTVRVAAQMTANGDEKTIRKALAGWIGDKSDRGVLNGPPWNLSVGLTE